MDFHHEKEVANDLSTSNDSFSEELDEIMIRRSVDQDANDNRQVASASVTLGGEEVGTDIQLKREYQHQRYAATTREESTLLSPYDSDESSESSKDGTTLVEGRQKTAPEEASNQIAPTSTCAAVAKGNEDGLAVAKAGPSQDAVSESEDTSAPPQKPKDIVGVSVGRLLETPDGQQATASPPSRLQRGTPRLTQTPSRPGAFRCGGDGNSDDVGFSDDSIRIGDDCHTTEGQALSPTPPCIGLFSSGPSAGDMTADLTVADLVLEGDDEELQRAQEVDSQSQRQGKQNETRHCKTIGSLLCVGIIVVVGLVVVVAGVFRDDGNTKPSPLLTSSPTAAATTEPPLSIEEHVLSLLPDFTVASIGKLDSPQRQAFEWIINDPNLTTFADNRVIQRYALAALYYATGGGERSGWLQADNWLSYGHHECDWFAKDTHGIYEFPETQSGSLYNASHHCDGRPGNAQSIGSHQEQDGTIQHLWLWSNDLHGSLPEEVSLLMGLRSISLGFNDLTGALPSSVSTLPDLEALVLFGNEMTGTLPTELGRISNLSFLWLMSNHFEGSMPSHLGQLPELKYLLVDSNMLTGKLPSELGLLNNLEWLFTWSNEMTGVIPSELGTMKHLISLAIDANLHSGRIPTELGLISTLETLHISDSHLTGTLPSELGLLTSVERLSVGGNPLTGTVPSDIWQMTQLHRLSLYGSFLSYTLPSELGLFTDLERFWIWDSLLSGSIPTEVGMLESLSSFALDANQLIGTLPSELGLLTQLNLLHLNQNKLTGSIPTEIGGMSALNSNLFLFSNELTGSIPSEIGKLENVTSLKLNDNNFLGSVPEALGHMEMLTVLSINNNSITGAIPPSLCNISTWTVGIWVDCQLVECSCEVCICDR